MKTWNLTEKTPTDPGNDVSLAYGTIKMDSDLNAIATAITSNLEVIKGELDDPEKGLDLFGIILSNTPLQMKVQEISRVINNVDGVMSSKFTGATVDRKNSNITFTFEIESVYGTLDYEKTFETNI
jgi:hypothetical protein